MMQMTPRRRRALALAGVGALTAITLSVAVSLWFPFWVWLATWAITVACAAAMGFLYTRREVIGQWRKQKKVSFKKVRAQTFTSTTGLVVPAVDSRNTNVHRMTTVDAPVSRSLAAFEQAPVLLLPGGDLDVGHRALVALDRSALERHRTDYRERQSWIVPVIASLLDDASAALERPLASVRDKTAVAPSNDPGDYYTPAPYWWPNPDTSDGLPYVLRDGVRRPESELWTTASRNYDRTSLQTMFDGTYLCALAGYLGDDPRYSDYAARQVRAWFIDPSTAMNPNLDYAQVRLGRDGNMGSPSGIIDFNDVYLLLDSVSLLESDGVLSSADMMRLHQWFAEYANWLESSRVSLQAASSKNNRGTWHLVQRLAVSHFLGDSLALRRSAGVAALQAEQQFAPDGSQPEELLRTLSQHYSAYNLQAWLLIERFLESATSEESREDVARVSTAVHRGVEWFVSASTRGWSHPQEAPFAPERVEVLRHIASQSLAADTEGAGLGEESFALRQRWSSTEGIRDYWVLGAGR